MVKDYYEILQVDPTANSTEIKAAYRKLAHQFHPDKNPGDKYALAQFYEVKEAYENLSTPSLKDEYLRERWLSKIFLQKMDATVNSPEKILLGVIDANKKLQTFDAFRIDKKGIAETLSNLLSTSNISILNQFDDTPVNNEIVRQALQITGIIHPAAQLQIFEKLKDIKSDPIAAAQIASAEKYRTWQVFFNKITPWLIVLAVLVLCALIYLSSS